VRAAIHDADPRVAELAIGTLGSLADDAIADDLIALLAVESPAANRAAAMRALALRGTPPDVLARYLDDEFAWVRYYAVQGLGRSGHVPAIPALVQKLRDASPQVRLAAIEALSSIDAPAALDVVLAAARSEDPDELRAALLGLGGANAALPVLLAAVKTPDIATRIVALSSLAKHSAPSAIEALIAAALATEPEIRDAAVSLLAERTDREAADALAEVAAQTDDPDHPVHAALSVPSPARISALRQGCASADERSAPTFASALGRMHDARATAALLELVAVPNAVSRRVAAIVLVEIGLPGAKELVVRMSREDPDPAVRRACAASSESLR
jgi:HEAT repeat protein